MDNLTRRVEHLEQDTPQIKIDLVILTPRCESFATIADIASVRTEGQSILAEVQSVLAEVIQQLAVLEARTNNRFDALNAKITWTLLIPAIIAFLAWPLQETVLNGGVTYQISPYF